MFFSFKTVGYLQVIHQLLSRPKQIRAGEYAVGRKIGLERVKTSAYSVPTVHKMKMKYEILTWYRFMSMMF
jgi:hypothetical protein